MSQAINRYLADLRDIRFRLFEQFRLDDVLGSEPFGDWGPDEVNMVLDEVYKFVTDVLGPINAAGDRHGCSIENGKVKAPPGFKEAWDKLNETGFRGVGVPEEFGGQGAPFVVATAVEEMMAGSNVAFSMYPGLAAGAAHLLAECGTEEQKKKYVEKLYNGELGGTMCLTEAQAGSDVGAATTKAIKQPDGRYLIEGSKIFISAGDHELTDDILHLVLARTEGAPAGTKGLSLFVVLRNDNDVATGSIEHKMGINGSSTCVLNFGENGKCYGELVGGVENQGMKQMFLMMNFARIGVGVQGLSVASSAYLNALEYAKERKQGPNIKAWKDADAPKVPIIEHPDVRRMLIDMKARVEGIRALIYKLAIHLDRVRQYEGKDDAKAAWNQGQVDLLVPLAKAYGSDQAFRVCETAIQTFGGAGFLKDHPVEQYCRDSKIFSIYEGTNHIQAMDLCGRKLGYKGGVNFQAFAQEIGKFVGAHKEHPRLGASVKALGGAMEALTGSAMRFLGWFQGGQLELVPLSANRFLEMMAETTVGWLLLDAAVIADAKLTDLAADHPDKAFYDGKVHTANYFARNVLPEVTVKAQIMAASDRSPMEIPDDGFATL